MFSKHSLTLKENQYSVRSNLHNIVMSFEFRATPPVPAIYDIDISAGWDTISQLEILKSEMKKLPFYRPDLLYSGFNADQIGKSWGSANDPGLVFCSQEEMIGSDYNTDIDPFRYAIKNDNSAIAVYDPKRLESVIDDTPETYKLKDSSAIIAIIRLV